LADQSTGLQPNSRIDGCTLIATFYTHAAIVRVIGKINFASVAAHVIAIGVVRGAAAAAPNADFIGSAVCGRGAGASAGKLARARYARGAVRAEDAARAAVLVAA
jgi:hypothetical protein